MFSSPFSLDKRELELLAPYASFSAKSLGRLYPEEEHPIRSAFQRDRDRIIHTTAFRRLEYKTQVFVNHVGDHYRTRLTHTIEVSQIARSIARVLKLNEELAEAIALAHDLGHPPFGHAGEKVLDSLMSDHGGFEHNLQSLRIVEKIEDRYPDFQGLNLTWETREGIIKYLEKYKGKMPEGLTNQISPTIEAQLVDMADEIAYNNHDLDDGLSSSLFDFEDLSDLRLWSEFLSATKDRFPNASHRILKFETIRRMINGQVMDLIVSTEDRVKSRGIESGSDVRDRGHDICLFSDSMTLKNLELKNFLMERMYKNVKIAELEDSAEKVLTSLFEFYVSNPKGLPERYLQKEGSEGKFRLICDYLSGMTDRYALQKFRKLFPGESVFS
ncbi:MAG: deoxyguanosinetriphosphate triphosphohydrolase [Nitrospinota bacterium]|nr:deoxyguanosinetriphosphate triphosphohydrolase [Nitrospinota bacterium]